jgi:hypothetical protein
MLDREWQFGILQRIFSETRFSPKFRENPKYEGEAPFIAYDDVLASRYVSTKGMTKPS